MIEATQDRHLEKSTAIILSAKHGQSPQTPSALTRIPDGPIIDALNTAWKAAHPAATTDLVASSVNDDGMLIWLNDRSAAATEFAKNFLLHHSGTGNAINGNPKPYTQSGLREVFAGEAAADFFKVPPGDARVPDVFGISQVDDRGPGGDNSDRAHDPEAAGPRPQCAQGRPYRAHQGLAPGRLGIGDSLPRPALADWAGRSPVN